MSHIIILDRCKELGGDPPQGGISLDLYSRAEAAHNILEESAPGTYPMLEAKIDEIETLIDGEFAVSDLADASRELADLVSDPC